MIELDECCDECMILYEFCRLTDCLVKDIKHLEAEIVRTRYTLSNYLEKPDCEFLRSDILANLAGRYVGNSAYDAYIKLLYNNQDPMDSKEWVDFISQLAHGHDNTKYL
ncbi:hypothetical protein [Anaerocolumna sp.]|uniref:hypothetical protein n=1 Tax=Anaerocolumna sp. TaxID=2041569 RepID=UPI0028B0BA11|nr:hypothetical protein [Anaerocolumna sp.]